MGEIVALLLIAASLSADSVPRLDPTARLGERIFHDTRFSSPKGDLETSCASCHLSNDMQGDRAFTDGFNRSWHPYRTEDPGRLTLRNSPTLFDVGQMGLIHLDGQFISLEEQTRETFLGRNLGWLPGEREDALAHLQAVLRNDRTYQRSFDKTMGVNTATAPPAVLLGSITLAVTAFLRTMTSPMKTPYDEFVALNGLDNGPASGESSEAYGNRILWQIVERQGKDELSLSEGFSEEALSGYKVFLRSSGSSGVGRCVICHVPPAFTDFQFHNTGVVQEEYEQIHGERSFFALDIPAEEEVERPLKQFMSRPRADSPDVTDLGLWNFYSVHTRDKVHSLSSLDQTIGAFKTPSLRHLAVTGPYLHNGNYPNLEAVLMQKLRAAAWAREGRLRNPDPALAAIQFSEEDLRALFAFLNTLNEPGSRLALPSEISPEDGPLQPGTTPYRGY